MEVSKLMDEWLTLGIPCDNSESSMSTSARKP